MKIEIWSDVVCPWCYIGKTNLEAALADFDDSQGVDVVLRSFLLDPAAPAEPTSAVDHLAHRYGGGRGRALEMMRQVTSVASGVGLEFHLEDSLTGQTRDAHRLLHLANAHACQPAVADRLFAAHFTEGRSVFDHESLTALGTQAGLPQDEVRAVLGSDTYADAVDADLAQATAYGINGVPFFVFDGAYAVAGAQPAEVLGQALRQVSQGL